MIYGHRTILWFAGIAGAVLMQGCAGTSGGSLGGSYDLSDYLFPDRSGTLLYKHYVAEQPKGTGSFGKEEYQDDVQYAVIHEGTKITVTGRENRDAIRVYTIGSSTITVEEKEADLVYHLDRTADKVENLIHESTIKQWREDNGDVAITYECNVTDHLESMNIEPDPKQYTDVLKMACLRQRTISATVGDKRFETVVETNEENYYAKDQGMIQSTATRCEFTRVDKVETSEDGCTKDIFKIWAFVAD